MIRFPCLYCGQRMRAEDELARKTAKCPACGHRVRVPTEFRAKAELPAATDEAEKLHWQGKTNREIARGLRRHKALTEQQKQVLATRRWVSSFMPQYDSLTLFALSAAFIVVVMLVPQARYEPRVPGSPAATGEPEPAAAAGTVREMPELPPPSPMQVFQGFGGLLALPALIGMLLSLVGVFYRKPKPKAVKWLMLCFAVLVTGSIGLYAGTIALRSTSRWLVVFPALNVIGAVLPLLAFRAGLLVTDNVVDTEAGIFRVLVTLISVVGLLLICLYGFDLHWALSYSICVGYVMSLNHTITDLFGRAPADQEAALASRTL